MMTVGRVKEQLLLAALDDWLHMADIFWIASDETGSSEVDDIRPLVLQALTELLDEGLIKLGDVTVDGFAAWPGTRQDVLARFKCSWSSVKRPPQPGEVCWLADTDTGMRLARELQA